MIDPMHKIIEQFPEKRDVIRQLRDTKPEFEALCNEYATVSDKLDALTRAAGIDVPARASALRKRRTAIEEELLTVIEGYTPA